MPSTFAGYDIANRALRASQGALNVIGHNISNINTPGYSRQTIELEAAAPLSAVGGDRTRPGQAGAGVELTAILRVRDKFVDDRILAANAEQGELNQTRDLLSRIEAVFMEPGENGISSLLTGFFTQFQELSRAPERVDIRTSVREHARQLVIEFNNVSQSLESIGRDAKLQVASTVDEANKLAKLVAGLNDQIKQANVVGDHANDLEDQRDEHIRRLSALVGVRTSVELNSAGEPTGVLNLFVAGHAIVVGAATIELPSKGVVIGGQAMLQIGDNNIPVGGAAAGILNAAEKSAGYAADLNNTVAVLIERVNQVHASGYGLDNLTGRAFFAGTDAKTIRVSADIEASVSAIAAATPPAAGRPVAAGNGNNARNIADIVGEKLFGEYTVGEHYGAQVSHVGVDSQSFIRQADSQEKIVQQLKNVRNSVSGVSLDEELAHMMQFQRSYQAAARVLSTMDGLMDDILRLLG